MAAWRCAGPPGGMVLAMVRRFATSTLAHGSRFYNPKVSNTMAKNASKHMTRMVELEEQQRRRRETRQGSKPQVKNPLVGDNRKTEAFNRQILENIGQAMINIPQLLGRNISITRAKVRPDFSEVLVFWVCRVGEEEETRLVLEEQVRVVRRELVQGCGMGQVPKLTFVRDLAFMLDSHMDRLFSGMDLGPGEEGDQVDQVAWEQLEGLELETSGLGLRRAEMMRTLEMGVEKSSGSHRYAGATSEEYCRVYSQTLARDGGREKLVVQDNIKKFLRERKKQKYGGDTEE